jgi:UDP-N-acetylglucosamine diphosphorylase / glucose-1-phosphate thymidylyltransferase / UDP-N-acetylgalactosamine diphosphorylase / glucosamine-1-phosphate N-acetyltransferase / galactosamine-1-phosphate N-acetyltransferase
MQVIVFEDSKVLELRPLVNLKPVYALCTGFRSLREKLECSTRGEVTLTWHLRRYLAPFYAEQHHECVVNRIEESDVLLVNGRIVFDEESSRVIVEDAFEPGKAYMQGDDLLFARVPGSLLLDADGLLPDLIDTSALAGELITEEVTGFRVISHIWDMIAFHPDELLRDAETLELGRIDGDVHPSAAIVNRSNIYVGFGAVVRAGAVLDGDEGFVAVGAGAVVDPQAVLMQNVFLAPWSRVKIGAKLYSNVAVGTASKVGGEVEDSLIEPFVNKQHDGFLGHSYISSWCNLGAGTNTSDLKNNYSRIKLFHNGRLQMTGLQFLGLLMGDHSKCSINSMFNTGTVVGTGANIFGGGFPPKEVPSFSWGGIDGFEPYEVEKAVETARRVMERRQVVMSSAYESMFRFVAGISGASRLFV